MMDNYASARPRSTGDASGARADTGELKYAI
jgi:hypothetical protein